ncbi:hypothetical protein GLA29479_2689 [Lysobacter antibioticus]|uniref:DUF5694 domain-containing protein n=1 Tax=Lysobacter antibioticus TaxID=84531 RepID=UPI000717070C|nr:DUF5694 domain-containing protein [Lysobacter antibioticus]ALN63555.1 hypothetical protein GLA29479_2689 [Lysobacter antibioticus]
MQKSLAVCGLLIGLFGCGDAFAQVDLSTLDRRMAGPPTQVLVLGSVHLSGLPKDFKHDSLAPVIDRLAAFKPEVITIEAISGEQCDLAARHPAIYGAQGMAPYCRKTDAAKAATGLDAPAAIAEAHKILKHWPAAPSPAQRRHLAAVFMAANDKASALVQWLQLPQAERRSGDGLDDVLVASLEKAMLHNDESLQIGARLAARLGLQRLHATDDHTGDNVAIADEAAYGKAVQTAWEAAAAPMGQIHEREEALIKSGDMLALYRYVNRPDVLRTVVDGDFGSALRDTSPEHYGRLYVAGWETRNLRMVANIREAFRERPAARVLSIVGRTHKPWFDNLLGQMQGVEIVDAERVLK